MKLTAKQKKDLQPYVRDVVQGIIDAWEAQRCIERILKTSFVGMNAAAEFLAVSYDSGAQVTLDDVQTYIDNCTEEG
jgi:hypothetical protein